MLEKSIEQARNSFFYLLIFLFPLLVLPQTLLPIALNKSYLAYFLVILIGLIHIVSALRSGKIVVPKNIAWIFLAVFLAVLVLSSFLSVSPHVSFFGLGSEVGTLGAFILFALTLFLAFSIFDSESKVFQAISALLGSFFVIFLFQLFQSLFKFPLLASVSRDPSFNLFGSWNELGIFSGLAVLLSLILFEVLPRSFWKVLTGVVLLSALVLTAAVNFTLVWWILAAVLIIFLAHSYSQKREMSTFYGAPFAVLIISLVFIFAAPLMTELINELGVQFVEIRPSLASTLEVASKVLKERSAFGFGPNTFLYAWFKHRPADIAVTPFWQTRFNSGIGFIPTLLITSGLTGALALLCFLGLFLWSGFRALVKSSVPASFALSASFIAALYLWIFAFVYSAGFSFIFFAFFFTGIFLRLAAQRGVSENLEISLFERSGPGFIGALLLILFVVLGVSWLSVLAQKYYAALLYADGTQALAAGKLEEAEDGFNRALNLDRRDLYLRSLTAAGLARLQQIVGRRDVSAEELRLQFQNALAQTIRQAQEATALNPADPLNWMNLGRVYEVVLPFQIQGAAEFAKNSYTEASKQFPSSPEPYLALARVEISRNDLAAAREYLKQAVSLKRDYAEAHFLLAQLEASAGNIGAAIGSAETTALLAPDDIGALFQLGLLYYQNRNFNEARLVLERAVGINSSYSNARYFLGLIYARERQTDKALGEFQKIAELNPANQEVKTIIQNLLSGRDPLFSIAPPGPAPEKRSKPPVGE